MKKILTLIAILVSSIAVKAQSGEISGKVVDEKGEGMISATVMIIDASGKNTGVGAVTDFDGNYSIKPLKPGKYDVKYSYAGYATQIQNGVYVKADQPTFLNVKLNTSDKVLNQVEVVAYKVPLIDRASTTNASTLSKDDIAALPTQNVADLVTTTAGTYQEDPSKGIQIRGGREEGTEYYVDGIKVIGKPNLPVQSIEQLTVITGGVPARYGDATGGVVNITTKGPASEFAGSISYQTSQGLDAYGYNQANANILGPIWKSKKQNRTILGFSAAFEFLNQIDRSPSAVGVWQVKDNVLNAIKDQPLYRNPTGTNFIFNSENLTFQDLYKTSAKPNNDQRDYKGVLNFNLSPTNGINLSFGGNVSYTQYHDWVRQYTLLNAENNPLYKELNYRVFGKFTHNVSASKKTKEGQEEKHKAVQNLSYSLQLDYEKFTKSYADETHGTNYFDYGYIGKFETKRDVSYIATTQNIGGVDYNGWIQSGDAQEVNVAFTPGTLNPLGARFTEQYFKLLGATQDANGTYRLTNNQAIGFAQNINQIEANRGLINGQRSEPIYNLWYNIGRHYNGAGIDNNNDQIRARVETSFDILKKGSSTQNKHSIELGIEFEQRVQRNYSINPLFLWDVARTNVNKHLSLDTSSPVFRINGNDYTLNDPNRPQFYFTDSITFAQKADLGKQGYFDRNLRTSLGLNPNGNDFLDLYAMDVNKLNIDQFSATELLSFFSGGGDIVSFRGYDHTGKILTGRPTVDDFFKKKNADGQYTRLQDAYRPIYASAYISDKFYYKDLGFMVGLRVDRFDANQSVLKDEYSLYDINTKKDVASLAGNNITHPGSIGDDYKVYVSKYGEGATITGYRNGDVWYDKFGNVSTARAISNLSSEGALPYVKLPGIDTMSTSTARSFIQTRADQYDPNNSFTKYKAQYVFMPRLQFSFNITENAQFFAHYDVLSQRPKTRNQLNLAEYLYWSENTGQKNNPNLKPETTIDYEFGFKQKVTKSSVITLSAYYKEFRNVIQLKKVFQAFPSTYTTYDNIDFVSVKGLNVIYDLRRTGNFKMNANYTLQFAEGTGSDDRSQFYIVDANIPNFRTIFPVSYDARHQINVTVDYRFSEGKLYNGPVIKNKQILANFGANLVLRARSGTPYSTSTIPTDQGSIGGGTKQNTASLNATRLPWSFRADLRVNKDFAINVARKGEDKDPKKLYFSVYVWIQNLFNTLNVRSVYRYTGSPSDDGFLDSPQKLTEINSKYNPTSYKDLYRAAINNPENYSPPRRIFLGASFNF